jgi:hypothetical protein
MKIMFLVAFACCAWVASIGLTYSKVDGVGTRVLIFAIGAGLCTLLAVGFFRSMHPLVADSRGISGLWVPAQPRTTHVWLDRLWKRGTWMNSAVPWDEIDHAGFKFIPGAEGGGSYRLHVYLRDGRKARAPGGALSHATAKRYVDRIESIRRGSG